MRTVELVQRHSDGEHDQDSAIRKGSLRTGVSSVTEHRITKRPVDQTPVSADLLAARVLPALQTVDIMGLMEHRQSEK